jgi:hypothetical protein
MKEYEARNQWLDPNGAVTRPWPDPCTAFSLSKPRGLHMNLERVAGCMDHDSNIEHQSHDRAGGPV